MQDNGVQAIAYHLIGEVDAGKNGFFSYLMNDKGIELLLLYLIFTISHF
jgi:hypothetical protein